MIWSASANLLDLLHGDVSAAGERWLLQVVALSEWCCHVDSVTTHVLPALGK